MAHADRPGLHLILQSGAYHRVHYALVLAAAAAATDQPVVLFITGSAVALVLAPDPAGRPGWHALLPDDQGRAPAERDQALQSTGVATLEELLAVSVALKVRFIVCEMAVRAFPVPPERGWRSDVGVEMGGVVGFLAASRTGTTLFI